MKPIDKLFLDQGDYFKTQIDTFLSLGISDVLDFAYDINSVDEYLQQKKQEIRNCILELFKNKKRYKFRETDEDFELTDDFFEYTLLYDGNLAKFKKHLKVASTQQLQRYHIVLFQEDLLLEKE